MNISFFDSEFFHCRKPTVTTDNNVISLSHNKRLYLVKFLKTGLDSV